MWLAQGLPYEQVLNAPPQAVLALIALVSVGALALALRALLSGRSQDTDCKAELERVYHEIDILRKRSHDQANAISEALFIARKLDRRSGGDA
jgi:hypothetical protein